jgi:hypothetical protein
MLKIYHLYPELVSMRQLMETEGVQVESGLHPSLGSVCSLEEMVQDALLALKKMGKNKS